MLLQRRPTEIITGLREEMIDAFRTVIDIHAVFNVELFGKELPLDMVSGKELLECGIQYGKQIETARCPFNPLMHEGPVQNFLPPMLKAFGLGIGTRH